MPARKTGPSKKALLEVTHPDRVLDPSTAFTKLDLARYYAEVASWALPHLVGRPAYIKRAPEGITAEMIFQQHPEGMPGLHGTDPDLWPGHEPAIALKSAENLVAVAQLSGIELHTWNSTAKAILQPDRMIFDLDPGDGVSWARMQEAAVLMRTMLTELGLKSWLKTTGGKGLHVVVPLKPQQDYPTVKGFSLAVAQHMARTIPERFVAKSGGSNRVGRIFIDYLRNGQSQSTAAAFSARARPGMGVSMPVTWEELPDLSGGAHWNIATAPKRLASLTEDPWCGYWKEKQLLGLAMDAMGYKPKSL